MWSKLKGLWNAFWENDACMREKTSFMDLVTAFGTGGWAGVGALAKDKAIECAKDPKGNCAAYAELGKVFNFEAPPCGGAAVPGKGERPPADDPVKSQHEARAVAIMRQLVGRPCSEDVVNPDGSNDRCRPGADGGRYTIDSSRFPLTGKQIIALQDDVTAAARLGKDDAEMLAEATRARDEFLAKTGIKDPSKYEPGSGGGSGSTDQAGKADKGLSTGAKVGIGAAAVALVGAIIYAATRKAK